jgi:ribosomal protein L11 methyltransferase
VTVPAEAAEEARARLLDLVPAGFEEVDRGSAVELAAYVGPDGERDLRDVFDEVVSEPVPPDWEERWRVFHRPVRIGPLWVGPPWERPPDDAVAVVIDPGRAFGTGAHPTTRLSLELLLGLDRGSVLDVGCGSGVLAIAAAKLGFGPVEAIDLDPAAVEAAAGNAERNAVRVGVRTADARTGRLPPADVAVANIALEAVEEIVPLLEAETIVTSGYLDRHRPALPGLRHRARTTADGWAADLYRRQ